MRKHIAGIQNSIPERWQTGLVRQLLLYISRGMTGVHCTQRSVLSNDRSILDRKEQAVITHLNCYYKLSLYIVNTYHNRSRMIHAHHDGKTS